MFSLLYIDDESGLLELGKLFLESTGEFEVTTALSAEAGLKQLAQRDFDAIVSDFQMPVMDGIELLKKVRMSFGTIPFVLFTGRGREEVVIEAINNGVDFYLQKGGDPKAQFAELAHKVRQAINKKRAETALSDSEKRLADIINFLPDATFAIDTRGIVIAWNRAMERMTGLSSTDVLGKGDYEYALPFYHERRPLLIDIVLSDNPAIPKKYPFVKKEGRTLFSEITIPHFNDGRGAALWFTASPLFNRMGEMVGAIESIREITERKRAEESLLSANREYTNLLEQIQDVYYRSDNEGRLVRASRSWATLFGYDDISECIGKNIADDFYVNPSDRKQLLEEIRQNGKVTGFQVLLRKKDGTPVLVEASSHLYFDPAGKIIGIEGTFRDITERKQAEEELRAANEQLVASEEELQAQYNELATSEERIRQSEQKYRTVFETTGTAMLMIEDDATISLVNAEFSRLSGYTREEIENRKRWTEFVVEEDRGRMLAQHRMRRENRQDALQRYEFRFVTRSGEIRDIFLSIDVVPGTRKSVASLLDITEKKKADDELLAAYEQITANEEELREQLDELTLNQTALKRSEGKFRDLVEASPDMIWEMDTEGVFTYMSPLSAEMIGFTPEEIVGKPVFALVPKEALAPFEEIFSTSVRTKKPPKGFDLPLRCRDGHVIITEIRAVVLADSDGRFSGFRGIARDITDKKKAADELQAAYEQLTATDEELQQQYDQLRKSEEELRMLTISVDQSADEVFWLDFEGTILYVNDAACRINGYSRDEFLKMRIYDLNPDLTRDIWTRSVTDLRAKKTQLFTTRHRHRDGKIIDVEIMSVYVRQDKNEYSFAFVRDITERKRSETVLAESERKYRTLFETADEGIWTIDAGFNTVSANRKMQEIFGYSEQEMLGRPVWAFVPPDDVESMKQALLVRQTGVPGRYERRWVRKDGTTIWCFTSASPLFSPDGLFIGSFGMFTDITERRRAEKALRESESKFRAVIDQSFGFIGLMTPDGILIESNRAALALIGISESDVINRPFWETPWWSHSHELQEKLKDAIYRASQGETMRFEATHPAADGHLVSVDFSIKPVLDPAGKILYLIPEGRDISDRKQAEEALRKSEEKYRTLVESSFDGIAIHQDGIIVYVNRTGARLLGSDDTALFIGKPAIDIIAPAYRELIAQRIREAPESMQELIHEQFLRLDGTPIDVDVTTKPSMWKGRPAAYVTFRDITAQLRAEEALRESSRKYAELFELGSEAIFLIDNETGALLETNSAACEMYGYPRDILLTMKNTDLSAEQEETRKITAETPQGIVRVPLRYHRRRDGTVFPVEIIGRFFVWNGRPVHIAAIRDITEHKRAEAALVESEEKYRTLVEVNRDIIYSLSSDGTVLYVSPQAITLLGYRPDEMVGRNFSDFVHPDDDEKLVRHIREHSDAGKPVPSDRFRVRRNDGIYRWFEDKTIYATDPRGNIIVAGTIRDITEEKAGQDALRESEEKFRALVETTGDFIWEIDAAGKYTYVSPQVRHILGYEPDDLVGRTPFDIMPRDEAEKISARFNYFVTSRLPISGLENRALKKDGSVVILETSGVVRTAEDGSYLGYRGIDRDITMRKRAEEALLQKTEELNRYFTASLDLFCIADTNGHFRRLNPEWEKTLGYTLGELEGHRFLDFVHPDDLQPTLAAVADLTEQKSVINFTNRCRHKDGMYRWIEWRSLPAGDLIFAAARDITARHEAAERAGRISALKQDLLRTAPLEEKLKRIADGIVDIFGADFARIWITMPGDLCDNGCIHEAVTKGAHVCRSRASCLHLIVSSGRYSHTDGGHRRVPLGAYKIGRIATGDETMFITNDVTHDPRVHDHTWAKSLGLESFAGFRLVSPEGNPVGVLAFFSRQPVLPEVMEDLTDLATTASHVIQTGMAEQAHRESEARLSSILHGSPVLQFVIDLNHHVISWNNALEEYSGIKAADIIGTDQQWRAFYPEKRPVLADLLVDGDADSIDGWYTGKFKKSRYIEGAYEATDFFPHMGSSGIWLAFTAAPIRDDRGTIIGAIETLEDVTDRVNAENALRESEERTRTILNTAQAGIVLVDAATHQIIDTNSKALELIGLPRESVIGSVCHRFICPAEEGKCPVTDCGQTVDTSERVLLAGDGTQIPVLKTVVPVMMADRNILVESFVDISEHKRSEAAIREANRKLNLLSSITRHDVANQLTAVLGYTQLAAMKKPDPVVADFLGKITTAVEMIQRQIQFSKEYQELGVHAPSWSGISDLIRDARPKKVRLRCTCDTVEVYADPMIGRVFFNLFDNAIRYGGNVTTITAGCKIRGDELAITFADNGVGIPTGEKEKIFEKGYGKNTGFGLFLAREILAITGITIHETGKPGRGARFEIVVPKGAYRDKE